MGKFISVAGAGALLAAGFLTIPGQAAQRPPEAVKIEGSKIANQLPKSEGLPESRVVRVVYPSPFATQQ